MFFFSSRRRHTRSKRDWSSDVCSSDLKALDGRIRAHRRFGTAVVLYGDGKRVDVVTARTEFYDAPAALPTVEHATIREDRSEERRVGKEGRAPRAPAH